MMEFCVGTANIRFKLRIFTHSHAKKVHGDICGNVGIHGDCGEKMQVFLWGWKKWNILCGECVGTSPRKFLCVGTIPTQIFFVWGGFAWVCDTGVFRREIASFSANRIALTSGLLFNKFCLSVSSQFAVCQFKQRNTYKHKYTRTHRQISTYTHSCTNTHINTQTQTHTLGC